MAIPRFTSVINGYLTAPLPVLALWQPYATLCVAPDPAHHGRPAKHHETRHWYPFATLPLRVAIHAVKKCDAGNRPYFTAPRFKEALQRCGFYAGDARAYTDRKLAIPGGLRAMPFGAIAGVATVTKILSLNPTPQALAAGCELLDPATIDEDDRMFGYFEAEPDDPNPNRYAWRLEDALMLPEPIAHIGHQTPLYPLGVDVREAINKQLRAMMPGRRTA